MTRLWKRFNGEPFLVNPHILSLNPRKRSKKKMARRKTRRMPPRSASGRFLKRRATANPRRRRTYTAKRRSYSAKRRTAPRRNSYFMNPRRRRARRNPPLLRGNRIFGMSLAEIAYAGAGFIAPPMIEGAVSSFIPDALKTSTIGRYAIKAGTVAALSLVASKVLSREAGKYLAIGGATYLLAAAIVEFAPQLFSGFGYTTMNPGPMPASLRGQVGLGAYFGQKTASSQIGVPARLSLSERL
jgi:hypothetical protein